MKREADTNRPSLTPPLVDILMKVEMRDQPCWNVSRVLGSMLVFDFGLRVGRKTRRGEAIEVGESELSIRNCFWTLSAPEGRRINSDLLDDERMHSLKNAVSGRTLDGCHQRNGRLYLAFGKDVTLGLDLKNRYEVEPDEEIAQLRTSLGHSISLAASGVFDLKIPERLEPARFAA